MRRLKDWAVFFGSIAKEKQTEDGIYFRYRGDGDGKELNASFCSEEQDTIKPKSSTAEFRLNIGELARVNCFF